MTTVEMAMRYMVFFNQLVKIISIEEYGHVMSEFGRHLHWEKG